MASVLTDNGVLILSAAVGSTAAYLAARQILSGHDNREPPLAQPTIPVVGHMYGLWKYNFNYYPQLSQQSKSPIITLYLLGQKMYIVTKPELIQAVQKQHKVLTFRSLANKFAAQICGTSPEARAILDINPDGDDGPHSLAMESYAAMHEALKPGIIDDMNKIMIREIVASLDELKPAAGATRKISLYSWLRRVITLATTRSVYGPMNPYEDEEISEAFWDFERGIITILVGILPSITAAKPIAARDKVVEGIEKYYHNGGTENASYLAKKRYQVQADNGLSVKDIARYEVGLSVAALVNTTPAAFWTLLLLHLDENLTKEIRQEIDDCIESHTAEDGTVTKTIDISSIKESCPLLLSSYQEVLRYTSMGASVREVMEDTYLENFFLKKGAMLHMPSRIIHQDKDLWGSNVGDFYPRRFMAEEKQNRPREFCFRPFGGGKTLCPGRHFSTNEILAAVSLFIARYDMKPANGGRWTQPTALNTNAAAVIMQPDTDVDVDITTRMGYEDVKWNVTLTKAAKIFALVTEDHPEKD